MRYRLRTLLIVLALGPPVLAEIWFGVAAYRHWSEIRALEQAVAGFRFSSGDYLPTALSRVADD